MWQVRLSAGTTPSGRRVERSATIRANGVRAAERAAVKVIAGWDAEDAGRAARRGTFGDVLDEWEKITASQHSPTTIYGRAKVVERARAEFGRRKLDTITARDLDRWYADLLASGLSAKTVQHHHSVVYAVLEQAWRWDEVPANVARKARPPTVRRGGEADKMPTVAALQVMLAAASPTVRTALLVSAATGCRRGEVVGLRWSDLNGNLLSVRRSLVRTPRQPLVAKLPKTAAGTRTIALPAWIVAELVEHRARQADFARRAGSDLADDGPMFANLRDDPTGRTPYEPGWLSGRWQHLRRKAKVGPVKLHGLRHLQASILADAGVSVAALSRRMGHAQVSTSLNIYTHALGAEDAAMADVVGDALSAGNESRSLPDREGA